MSHFLIGVKFSLGCYKEHFKITEEGVENNDVDKSSCR